MTVAIAYRGSADGRQGYGPATQFMRGVYGPLDSPKGSTCGKRDSCTGGGHGEAAPSNPGAARNGPVGSPIPRHSASQVPPSAASPLARHIAARALRGSRPNDGTSFSALSLPSLSSSPSLRVRDVGGSGGGAQSPTGPAPSTDRTQSPRPPTAIQAYLNEPSPRARRSSTFNDATVPAVPPSASPPPAPSPCPPSSTAAAPASPFTAAPPTSPFSADRERFRGLTLQPSPQQGPQPPSPVPSPQPPARQYSSPLHAHSPDYQASKSRSGRYVVDLAAHAAATGVPLSQPETPLQRVQSPRSTLRPDVEREQVPAQAPVRDLDESEDDLPVKSPPVMKPSANVTASSTVSSYDSSSSGSTSSSARRLVQPAQTLKQQLQQQQAPGLAAVRPFRALPVPGEGLLYQSPKAPAGLHAREGPWSVSDFRVLRKLYAGYASR